MTAQNADDVAAATSGDQRAFGRLIEICWPRLVRLARSIVGDLDAEDVAQDACVACWRKLAQLRDLTRFDGWLMRIVYTRAVRRARWQRLHTLLLWDPASAGFASPSAGFRSSSAGQGFGPASQSSGADADVFVAEILARLAPRQRAVLYLAVVEGMSDSEIAATLGIRAGSVRAHRRRARERIGAWMPRETCRADLKVRGSTRSPRPELVAPRRGSGRP